MTKKLLKECAKSLRRVDDFFAALDKRFDMLMTGIANRFIPTYGMHNTLKFLEPLFSGIAIAAVLWVVGLVRGPTQYAVEFSEFVESAFHHARPVSLALGLLAFGVALLIPLSDIGRWIHKLVSAPLLRFSHHASLLALGAFLVFSLRQLLTNGLAQTDLFLIVTIVFSLVILAGISFVINLYIECPWVPRLELRKSYRYLSILV